ncbi:lysylphosphatidylglycerol synthase transmembrane domain-containing protein [Fulvivirgaceae bacterium BMA12]|uniref:Lysylphosphatidylglycerol synthase transmembrane domain-containing protein n=1 Tax=Agaribacillus aureus TaxID=3051825 RepID=A0ABT8L0I5_9BACT|nr:lysylphosphatidylglycerol synthase transmembrane domain-containing protein [Fulvivirgaceae bacterium BMA12]
MKKILKILKIIVPIGIGIYLTWFFFHDLTKTEISQVKRSFLSANYLWVILSLIVTFLSHLVRARRWLLLVAPMGYKPKLSNAYHGVMAGYIINYTIPRAGEFARVGLMARYEKLPIEKGIATIVIERVIDMIMLGLIILVTGYMQVDSDKFDQIMQTQENTTNIFWPWIVVIVLVLGITAFILYLRSDKFRLLARQKIMSLWEGLRSFQKMEQKWRFTGYTFFIWICYVGGVWIFAQAFNETANMPVESVFGVFVVGAAAIAILPGGLGAYPLWVNKVLVLYGIHFAGFGIFVWVVTTVLMIVLGLTSLFLIQRKKELAVH